MKRVEYTNYGTYRVTTEGDCEGRCIKELGVYTGYIDEIAFALADKCCYKLCFHKVEPHNLDMTPKSGTVTISLGIDSGTWDLNASNGEALVYFKRFFAGRDLEVVSAGNYGTCKITTRKESTEEKRLKALSKLSSEEKQILGLE